MADLVVTTIWQSPELHESSNEINPTEKMPFDILENDLVPEKLEKPKPYRKKKKAVSFHGVEPLKENMMHWRLQLKRSSASTNVSVLNLANLERIDSADSSSTDESGISDTHLIPPEADMEPEALASDLNVYYSAHDGEEKEEKGNWDDSPLSRAKDSITNLKMKTSELNKDIDKLRDQCSTLHENLENSRQDAKDLEEYCHQLEESCKEVAQTVAEVESKASVLQHNSYSLEEKLKKLRQHVKHESEERLGKLQQELEENLLAGISPSTAEGLLGHSEQIHQAMIGIITSVNNLNEKLSDQIEELHGKQKLSEIETNTLQDREIARLPTVVENMWEGLSDLRGECQKVKAQQKEAMGIITHFSSRFETFLIQWDQAQREQSNLAKRIQDLRSDNEEITTTAKRTVSTFTQLRDDLENIKHMRPLLENVWKELSSTKIQEYADKPALGRKCASCYGNINADTLKILVDQAISPLVKEVQYHAAHQIPCPNCRRSEEKILELERQLREMHFHYSTLSSGVRLVKDEVLRMKHLLFNKRFRMDETPSSEDLYNKACTLKEYLDKLTAGRNFYLRIGCRKTQHPALDASDSGNKLIHQERLSIAHVKQ